jgi:hypothetical protein
MKAVTIRSLFAGVAIEVRLAEGTFWIPGEVLSFAATS